jgi:hypothetical protein
MWIRSVANKSGMIAGHDLLVPTIDPGFQVGQRLLTDGGGGLPLLGHLEREVHKEGTKIARIARATGLSRPTVYAYLD